VSAAALFRAGLALAALVSALHLWLLWPLPGSQGLYLPGFSLWLHESRGALVLGALVLSIGAGAASLRGASLPRRSRILQATGLLSCLVLVGADRWADPARFFLPPEPLRIESAVRADLADDVIVMGIEIGKEHRAYPVGPLAYHHWVDDELGGVEISASYCPLARTGRVFRSDGEMRLAGLLRQNSVYQDLETGSFWQQADGRAIAGPRRGQVLEEIPSGQMTWAQWRKLHPDTTVMLPDPSASAAYASFGFDQWDARRPRPDAPAPLQWLAVLRTADAAAAVPWDLLQRARISSVRVGDVPALVWLHPDGVSLSAFDRRFAGEVLDLLPDPEAGELFDLRSGARFDFTGRALSGPGAGGRLRRVAAAPEFRHAWQSFGAHPAAVAASD